jgi:hypothetical protein
MAIQTWDSFDGQDSRRIQTMTGASYELRAELRSSRVRIFLVRKQQQECRKIFRSWNTGSLRLDFTAPAIRRLTRASESP